MANETSGLADPYAPLHAGIGAIDTASLISACATAVVCGGTSAAAGVGGGGLFMPLYSVALGVGSRAAVPISKVRCPRRNPPITCAAQLGKAVDLMPGGAGCAGDYFGRGDRQQLRDLRSRAAAWMAAQLGHILPAASNGRGGARGGPSAD
jgi:hypothetical protein